MTTQAQTARTDWVDAAKGIGIVLVVYGHVARGLHTAGLYPDDRAFALVDDVIYSFHMPLFFLLSGLFFQPSLDRYGARRLIGNKVDTLLYPYFLWSLIQGGIQMMLRGSTSTSITFGELVRIPWQPLDQFWFLYALFFIVVLFGVSLSWGPRGPVAWGLMALLLIAYITGLNPPVPALSYIAHYGVFFAAGVLLAPHLRWLARLHGHAGAALAAAGLFLGLQATFHVVAPWMGLGRGLAAFLLAMGSIFCVMLLAQAVKPAPLGGLQALGRHSLGIYLMHILFASGTRIMLSRVFGVHDFWVQLLGGVAVGLLGPLLLSVALDRLRWNGLLTAPPKLRFSR
ncbi:acyltransferase family protein [Thiomonas intermedia]|uniref:acyltransferase family protein n=1 Tax=Thiomonas intermedia TaxID=926 RepID=UPI0009A4B1F0|nr:acyltransferase [Thiomonas intermedia]